eukprot:CAMPEP_0182852532 /NCGR_PEP_ID=MMETSP0034_2-20130328/208_1 /TAXON_ID=156128 /ORGANISM="Nephroselmis pyriformis, Strain CCMP717" /LENGTH=473 /DNA_ID=CAMNT_0024983245 /DNA_START=608 /DNA_END=2030 /DNA_ORIENTATION=+
MRICEADGFPSPSQEEWVTLPSGSEIQLVVAPAGDLLATVPDASGLSGLKKHIVIFEVEGGSDKGPDGHRKDTMPIVEMLRKKGWTAEVMFYSDASWDAAYSHVISTAGGFISRINPGKYPQYTEARYFELVRALASAGVVPMPHCDAQTNYGAKDSLVKLAHTKAGLPDTFAYYEVPTFRATFPASIRGGPRVLKQNRGSTGEGIWVVRPHGWAHGDEIDESTMLLCTEMVDNHSEVLSLGDFMTLCEKYIGGDGGHLVDQRFLPRIVEGELRVLMIGAQVINVVHKKPSEGNLSATLFSGATYSYDPPSQWPALVNAWAGAMPEVRETLGGYAYPLIWTADFILDTNEDGSDAYRLGEINCSCVGFTSELALAETVADEAIRMVEDGARVGAALEVMAEVAAVLEVAAGESCAEEAATEEVPVAAKVAALEAARRGVGMRALRLGGGARGSVELFAMRCSRGLALAPAADV